jgi:predicted nucleic acid-binding protein
VSALRGEYLYGSWHLTGNYCLDRCNAINLPEPSQELVDECNQFVHHPGDAIVLAAAWKSEADYFITLDRRHFIENKALREAAHFYIGTPGDFLDWFRGLLISADRNN